VGISYPCFMERGSGQTTAVVFAAIAIATHFKRKVIIISRPPPILSDAFKLADIDEESKPDISFDEFPKHDLLAPEEHRTGVEFPPHQGRTAAVVD